jgi:hypothetical protein
MYSGYDKNVIGPYVQQQDGHMIQTGVQKAMRENILSIDTALCKRDNMIFLGEKLTDIKSLEVDSVDIPYAFYNITEKNNKMTIAIIESSEHVIEIEPGYYDLNALVSLINTNIDAIGDGYYTSDISLVVNPITKKSVFTSGYETYLITFPVYYDTCIGEINGLGSVLGFTETSYTFGAGTLISERRASIKTIRHLYLAVNEFSQHNKNGFFVPTNVGRLDQNIIARICIPDLQFGQAIQASHGNGYLVSEVRQYAGIKTVLQKLQMTLYSDRGDIVNPGDYVVNFKVVL